MNTNKKQTKLGDFNLDAKMELRRDYAYKNELLNLYNFALHRSKIGRNVLANKFYHLNGLIGLDTLDKGFVHFKKLMKIQFLKNGIT